MWCRVMSCGRKPKRLCQVQGLAEIYLKSTPIPACCGTHLCICLSVPLCLKLLSGFWDSPRLREGDAKLSPLLFRLGPTVKVGQAFTLRWSIAELISKGLSSIWAPPPPEGKTPRGVALTWLCHLGAGP